MERKPGVRCELRHRGRGGLVRRPSTLRVVLVEVVEVLKAVPEFCSCFFRGAWDGVSAFVESGDRSTATGKKRSDHGLGFVLVPEVFLLQGVHSPSCGHTPWPPLLLLL